MRLYRGAHDAHDAHGAQAGYDAAFELATAHALVRRCSAGELDEAVRIHRPGAPVVAFGRADTRLAGFARAADAARAAGFQPVVRATGGRAVAYTTAALVVDHVRREPDPTGGLERRFVELGALLADVLRGLGVDARVGAVPGEYCPGAQSVNARGVVKLVGTAQRVVRQAWLFSSLLVVGDAPRLRPLLTEVYGALEQPFDEASVGAVSDESPGVDPRAVEGALLSAYAGLRRLEEADLDADTVSLAAELTPQHRA